MTRAKIRVFALVGAIAFLMAFAPALGAAARNASQKEGAGVPAPGVQSSQDGLQLPIPAGYVHRPSVEFFTGLSCPSCMAGPHPDMERMWNESGYDPRQDFTYVTFHELNGGGVDDLNSQDSTDRMRYYQPGISGTPDAEFDGGYIELGGMTGGTLNYDTAKTAVKDSQGRDQTKIDPRHPVQSLRNGFKFVRLEVRQMFDGSSGFAVAVKATYLGTTALVDTKALNGQLCVFMVEDNVTAFSTNTKQNELNHNVFRGYAFKDQTFSLKSGESKTFSTNWDVPKGGRVPVKPGDISAVAVVYDADDTTSQPGAQGNPNRVPRAIQSATPLSTAYDSQCAIPQLGVLKMTRSGDRVKFTASFDAPRGIAAAYALYNSEAANATNWSVATFNLTGSNCKEGETCSVYNNATGTVVLGAPGAKPLYVTMLMYDGNMTQGRINLNNLTAHALAETAVPASIPGWAVGGVLGGMVAVGIAYLWKKGKLPIGKRRQSA
jgi:hypothetical protein